MTIPLSDYLIFSAILFVLSMVGFAVNRKNIINLLMSIELLLLSVNTNFIAFSHFYRNIAGEAFVFFILTVAAAEAAIGLAIMMTLFKKRKSIAVQELDELRG